MVVTILRGGLGNQLFQFAAGMYLSAKHRQRLFLDGRELARDPVGRTYSLGALNLPAGYGNTMWHLAARFMTMASTLKGWRGLARYLREEQESDLSLLQPSLLTVIDGYWQTHAYCSPALDVLRERFSSDGLLGEEARTMASRIDSERSLAVHVRRGDYMTNPSTNAFHGVCTLRYYLGGVEHVRRMTRIDCIYVFSDDLAWARQHLRFKAQTVFANERGTMSDLQELALMSRCGHFVISNSSYSWWAAKLGAAPGKVVVAPKRWFAEPRPEESRILDPTWYLMEPR